MKKNVFLKIWGSMLGCLLVSFLAGLIVAAIQGFVLRYLCAAGIALSLSAAASLFLALRLTNSRSRQEARRLSAVTDSVKGLNAGLYYPLNTEDIGREFAQIANEINALNESTHAYMHRVERERCKLTSVLDNVSQGVVALNYKKELVFVNDSALVRFGGGATKTGSGLAKFIDDSALCEKIEARLGEEEFSFTHEYEGKALSVVGKSVSKEEEEKGLANILLFTDISGEREIIRQKSEFFANASHELKTPITVMRGLTEILLSKEGLDETEKKQIERIHKESLRMAELISDMLKLSKLERSEEEERSEVDLRETVEETLSELSEGIAAKNISVTVEGRGKVYADPKRIFEIVQNLCANAVNYNKPNGWICVRIEDTGAGTRLTVEDGGIGIEKEHIPRLCERFYRVDKSRSKKTGGTGLGLAIVKHICALYKAKLEIFSKIGEGTTVVVLFPKGE